MKKTLSQKALSGLLLAVIIALAGCNFPQAPTAVPTQGQDAIFTAAAQTLMVELTNLAPQDTLTPAPATETFTPEASSTPLSTATATPIPCNKAQFVADVNYPDGTEVLPGANFTKTWRLKNTGSCTWTSGYVFIFENGERMDAPASAQVTAGTVPPGATVEISANLKAPAAPGTYQANFRLRSADNIVFGIGSENINPFWVKIVVPSATATTVPKPDLIISALTLSPSTPTKGNPVSVSVTVYNQGNAAAGAFNVKWWGGENFPTAWCSWDLPSMVALGGQVLTCTYNPGYSSWYGSINTKAAADTAGTVAESNESNNIMLVNISVNP